MSRVLILLPAVARPPQRTAPGSASPPMDGAASRRRCHPGSATGAGGLASSWKAANPTGGSSTMRFSQRLLTIVIAALAVSSAVQAQSVRQRPIRVGVGGGMTVPRDGAIDALKQGINGQGFVQLNVPGLPGIRIGMNYNKFDWKQ